MSEKEILSAFLNDIEEAAKKYENVTFFFSASLGEMGLKSGNMCPVCAVGEILEWMMTEKPKHWAEEDKEMKVH